MATGTGTRTAPQTNSLTKSLAIVYVTRKVQADFLAIMDTYGYFSEDYARKIIADVRTFLDEDVIDTVKFVWKEAGTNNVLEELCYVVISGGIGLADDRPGGIKYNAALKNADFTVYVTYNDRWKKMNNQQQQAVRDALHSILKFFQVDSTGMFRMTSSARHFKQGVGSSRPSWRWIMCFLERPKANTSCKACVKRFSFS